MSHSQEDQSSTLTWHNPHYPNYPHFSEHTALDYFCNISNPFYSVSSLNQQLKSQGLSQDLLSSDEYEGVRFEMNMAQEPRLFIIMKSEKRRVSGGAGAPHEQQQQVQTRHLAIYYILDGVVYQAPILFDVIDSRIQNCMTDLEKMLVEMQDCLRLSVDGTHRWMFPGDEELTRKHQQEMRDEYTIRERSMYPVHIQNHVGALIQQMEHETVVKIKEKQDLEEEAKVKNAG